ncbi:inositol monophosphatase family protein [Streptomyces johnsoniae]|uniref:inositol-phosphate phosphatase n=1 Tax=Streptomyces johnsoniae TaxID=3075532 RepID=A0ABU2S776_9ACTN|nr:inositol monophosphatase family protein [Streptomyces sp. DSM 41886]MDT0444775.1 inositol monophosphatase family protein [Streptomyces sp. DSM 41886]
MAHPGPHPALTAAADAARAAYTDARARHDRATLAETVEQGADGTPTMRIDRLVEDAVLRALEPHRVNVLSEESGWVDRGSEISLVIDPLDGSANGAAGVPLTAFAGTVAVAGEFTESYTSWLDTGRGWWAHREAPTAYRTSGRRELAGAALSMLRPHTAKPGPAAAWWAAASRAARVRVLSTTCLEAALVAEGATDAFADACSDTHRLVDLAAATVLVGRAGGVVLDVRGRPVEFTTDLTRRWSGVVAATEELGRELVGVLHEAAASAHR